MASDWATLVVHRFAVVARGCRGDLVTGEKVTSAARRAATASGLTLVAEATFAYVPHGVSVALLLAQSHLVISTWPEHGAATVDLAVCADEQAARAVWSELNRYLRPTTVKVMADSVNLASLLDKDQDS